MVGNVASLMAQGTTVILNELVAGMAMLLLIMLAVIVLVVVQFATRSEFLLTVVASIVILIADAGK